MIASLLNIDNCPKLQVPPVTVLATLCDSHATVANSTGSINVGSSASAFELLTRFDTGHRCR